MLGDQRLRVFLPECETLLPKLIFLPPHNPLWARFGDAFSAMLATKGFTTDRRRKDAPLENHEDISLPLSPTSPLPF
eukprot:CAMPEP_0169444640 /NCGR_PEP_ID=MMETSP1042-20121227/10008_1 /TAXON_ID=464988 /ORGANISM="Hemiselmis andersenii, Strain CCMP1180" /LENGTH=76 /DNA_ID=CAMNT_0009555971 /DNA_START=453 /DNA_END=680 /DNA_ORIENTATION=-